ncbi:DUF305 domain-containing protein [Actinomadura rudentiformis]|uniref:DUF305 domain-containing protein n=1 Tax=Actinomadura rudentiformis TaxID=359158 RepID=A0A6H9ZB70_9ACTN|nr:DUF305 domain-containing protein [Actinomadura rudentiformis]
MGRFRACGLRAHSDADPASGRAVLLGILVGADIARRCGGGSGGRRCHVVPARPAPCTLTERPDRTRVQAEVRSLADSIVNGQRAEIEAMQQMLRDSGAPRASSAPHGERPDRAAVAGAIPTTFLSSRP